MAVRRERFRIEDFLAGGAPASEADTDDSFPMQREIMAELRAIRAQMAGASSTAPASDGSAAQRALLDSYRAKIERCDRLKVELDLIHDAISRTKHEIAVLQGRRFSGDAMAEVTGELDAVVGGAEQATDRILEAAEVIDQAAAAMAKVDSSEQRQILGEEIQERVVAIFEACNFQDLTGQRIAKVMTTMRFVEHHIGAMMEIWGGIDAIKAQAPPIVDRRDGDARLLNGPRSAGDAGHASQDDIDALFD